jgi:uncharacterized protein (DUF4415 family)
MGAAKDRAKAKAKAKAKNTAKDKATLKAAADDPDTFIPGEEWWSRAKVMRPVKRLVSLRLDPDVLDWYKSQGPGYQSKINAVLKAYKEHAG